GGPQGRMHVIVGKHLDQEHCGSVHDHEVAGIAYSDAERLRESIDSARHHWRTRGQTRLLRRLRMDGADHFAGPSQVRQRYRLADLPRPVVMPVELRHPVERVTLARGVMIKNVFTGQLRDDEGVTAVPPGRGSPNPPPACGH